MRFRIYVESKNDSGGYIETDNETWARNIYRLLCEDRPCDKIMLFDYGKMEELEIQEANDEN